MADRIAVMNEGRIDQLGSPSEIYDKPATPFVADFIGDMNHLEGTLEKTTGGELVVELPGGRAGVAKVVVEAQAGSRVRVGVRPEELHARSQGEGSAATTVTAMVLGHYVQVVAQLSDGKEVVARQPRASTDARLADLQAGDPVWIDWPSSAALLLGPADGSRPATSSPEPVEAQA